jgi:adenosylcobinamide-GDP ribazoletransferase
MLRELWSATAFLTTLPTPRTVPGKERPVAAVAAYPVVGMLLGAILVGADTLLTVFDPPLRGALVTGIWLVLTGALHLDGLCDVADAALAPRSPAERRLISRDPAVGAFGLAAAVVILLIKSAGVASLASGPWLLPILILSRSLLALPMAWYPTYAGSRLGARARPSQAVALLALALGVVLSALAAAMWLPAGALPALLGAGLLVTIGLAQWLHRRLEGLGGDAYGALVEVTETSLLLVAALW